MPTLPGAAPSCGPVEGPGPGEDTVTPGGPSTGGSIMIFRARTAGELKIYEFAVSLLRLAKTSGPYALRGHRRGGPRRATARRARSPGRPAVVCKAPPLHPRCTGWRRACGACRRSPAAPKSVFLARRRPTGPPARRRQLTADLEPVWLCLSQQWVVHCRVMIWSPAVVRGCPTPTSSAGPSWLEGPGSPGPAR